MEKNNIPEVSLTKKKKYIYIYMGFLCDCIPVMQLSVNQMKIISSKMIFLPNLMID